MLTCIFQQAGCRLQLRHQLLQLDAGLVQCTALQLRSLHLAQQRLKVLSLTSSLQTGQVLVDVLMGIWQSRPEVRLAGCWQMRL